MRVIRQASLNEKLLFIIIPAFAYVNPCGK